MQVAAQVHAADDITNFINATASKDEHQKGNCSQGASNADQGPQEKQTVNGASRSSLCCAFFSGKRFVPSFNSHDAPQSSPTNTSSFPSRFFGTISSSSAAIIERVLIDIRASVSTLLPSLLPLQIRRHLQTGAYEILNLRFDLIQVGLSLGSITMMEKDSAFQDNGS